jgi:hypothetical protein
MQHFTLTQLTHPHATFPFKTASSKEELSGFEGATISPEEEETESALLGPSS